MRTNIFLTTLLALSVAIGYASCNERDGKGKAPADMHEVTYEGFTFLCPDVLKPAQKLDGSATVPNVFTLSDEDISNALSCEVSDDGEEFSTEMAEQMIKEMKAQDPKLEAKVLPDGAEMRTVTNDPSVSSETVYMAMRIFVHGKKSCTVTLMYTEKNKETLGKYADAVINSVKVAK